MVFLCEVLPQFLYVLLVLDFDLLLQLLLVFPPSNLEVEQNLELDLFIEVEPGLDPKYSFVNLASTFSLGTFFLLSLIWDFIFLCFGCALLLHLSLISFSKQATEAVW